MVNCEYRPLGASQTGNLSIIRLFDSEFLGSVLNFRVSLTIQYSFHVFYLARNSHYDPKIWGFCRDLIIMLPLKGTSLRQTVSFEPFGVQIGASDETKIR